MIIPLVIIGLLCLWGIRFSGFHEDYCAPGPTTAIKGIFVILIFLSHFRAYTTLPDTIPNQAFIEALDYIGQSMVALFFFYSGFGIAESVRNKPAYKESFFRRRLLKTLLHFDLALLLFIITTLCLDIHFPAKNYIYCWIGWKSIGNSNWFIFVVLALYFIAFVAMRIPKIPLWINIVVPSIMLWGFLYYFHADKQWWYDTIIAFPLGALFSSIKTRIDSLLRKTHLWWIIFIILVIIYVGSHYLLGVDKFGIVSGLFCLMIVVFTMKVQISNAVLLWLGKNAFSIYILQRLPMLVLSHFGLNQSIPVFLVLSLILTLLLAWGFSAFINLMDKKLFARG